MKQWNCACWLWLIFFACTPTGSRNPVATSQGKVLPRYAIVGQKPTYSLGPQAHRLLPGFGVVVVSESLVDGQPIAQTSLGWKVPMKDLELVTPSSFSGVLLRRGGWDFGWIIQEGTPARESPTPTARIVARYALYTKITRIGRNGKDGYYQVPEGWVAMEALRIPTPASPPLEIRTNEHWIDVDLRSQTLVAYEGKTPLFATLVSTGVGAPGTAFATPAGLHRVQAKARSATMDNLEHSGVVPYSYDEVPYTQYIGRVALHGTFWHDQFGHRRSHGCINLSVNDAEWLFSFTQPTLLLGDNEVVSSASKPGTLIRVR